MMNIASGVLNIISGTFSIIIFILFNMVTVYVGIIGGLMSDVLRTTEFDKVTIGTLVILTILFLIAGFFSLMGGIFALKKKHWFFVFTGSIFSLMPLTTILGISAIVMTIKSRKEFR